MGDGKMGSSRLHTSAIRTNGYGISRITRNRNANSYSSNASVKKPSKFSHLWLIPHSNLSNERIDPLVNSLSSMHLPFYKRWNGKWFDSLPFLSWEINLIPEEITFNLTLPQEWEQVFKKQLEVCWSKSTIKNITDPLRRITPTAAGVLELKEHYIFPLNTDKRKLTPIDAILDAANLMTPLDKVVIQVLITPGRPDWWEYGVDAYESYKGGDMPQRVRINLPKVIETGLTWTTSAVLEGLYILQEFFGVEPDRISLEQDNKAKFLRDGPMGRGCIGKLRGSAFETTIRVVVQSSDQKRAETLLRSIGFAFRELDEDNALLLRKTAPAFTTRAMRERKQPIKINHDYLSVSEVTKLIQMPPVSLQQEYKIKSISHTEVSIPESMRKGGMLLGYATCKGNKTPVYIPTNNRDELCSTHCVIGEKGTGKSKGYAANMAVEAHKNKFSVIVIDPARGEIGDEIESVVPKEDIIRFKFGKEAYSLDWREVNHATRAKSRLANAVIEFFDVTSDPAGAQTVRHLRSACKVVPDSSIRSVIRMFTDTKYLESLIPNMNDMDKETWESYLKSTEQRKMQIAAPVWNRLDTITGDEYLSECIDARNGIDIVKLLEKPKVIIFDVSQHLLTGREIVNIWASVLATKIDIAMFLRKSTHPVFNIWDEPHQYLNSAATWKNAVAEARKWGFSYTFLFHGWEQLPINVARIIQDAGVNYHLYNSSKRTFQSLAEEIKPFTVEEAMNMKTHHAINTLTVNKTKVTPFMAQMALPPSMRKERMMSSNG